MHNIVHIEIMHIIIFSNTIRQKFNFALKYIYICLNKSFTHDLHVCEFYYQLPWLHQNPLFTGYLYKGTLGDCADPDQMGHNEVWSIWSGSTLLPEKFLSVEYWRTWPVDILVKGTIFMQLWFYRTSLWIMICLGTLCKHKTQIFFFYFPVDMLGVRDRRQLCLTSVNLLHTGYLLVKRGSGC